MKILLVQPMSYLFSWGGAHKANRILIQGLAKRGHTCRVVAAGPERLFRTYAQFLDELSRRGIETLAVSNEVAVFCHQGVQVHAAANGYRLGTCIVEQMREFEPTWTLVSEDPTSFLLGTVLEMSPSRAVYVSHSQTMLPFGPACFSADPAKTDLLRRAAGIITVSDYVKEYFRRWGDLESVAISFPVYGSGPFPRLGRFDQGYVTLVNPSVIKGLAIFVALARALPQVPFAAVPTWGTTKADRAALERLPNVRLLPPADDIDEIFAQTRVLLAPSLWGEAFGQIVVEAMLRGIPVLASDSGGLPEAKLGVDYVLPVRPIERYEEHLDDRDLPVAVVPEQDVGPWLAALQELLTDRARYEGLATASREAALAFVSGIGIEPFETFLERLAPAGGIGPAGAAERTQKPGPQTKKLLEQMGALSPERLALLASRLRERGGAKDERCA